MPDEVVAQIEAKGRKVRTETLAVAPTIVGLSLAEPWRRLIAMIIDLIVVASLSLLSGPFLGITMGLLLALILGRGKSAPLMLRIARWVLRVIGAGVVFLSILALGHSSITRWDKLNLAALRAPTVSVAMQKTVFVGPNESYGRMRAAVQELQQQVEDLKSEVKAERASSRTLAGRTRALTGTLGVTFGWSGIYFTLLTGLCNGRTLGKFILGIRAAKINGTPFTYFDGFLRQGGYIAGLAMGMIGFLKLLWEPNRQAVEDRIAATVVVKI